jgi:hypothetical protein
MRAQQSPTERVAEIQVALRALSILAEKFAMARTPSPAQLLGATFDAYPDFVIFLKQLGAPQTTERLDTARRLQVTSSRRSRSQTS